MALNLEGIDVHKEDVDIFFPVPRVGFNCDGLMIRPPFIAQEIVDLDINDGNFPITLACGRLDRDYFVSWMTSIGERSKTNVNCDRIGQFLEGWRRFPLYLLEINPSWSYKSYRSQLPLEGFGQHLGYDVAESVHKLALRFTRHENLFPDLHVSSMPIFQAICSSSVERPWP